MPDKPYEDVEIEGHLIDSLTMPQTMDEIVDLEGEHEVLTFDVGRAKDDPSHAVLRIFGRDAAHPDDQDRRRARVAEEFAGPFARDQMQLKLRMVSPSAHRLANSQTKRRSLCHGPSASTTARSRGPN